jgi:hypothetical protein
MSSNIKRTRAKSDASRSAFNRLTIAAPKPEASSFDSPGRPGASAWSALRRNRRSAEWAAHSPQSARWR